MQISIWGLKNTKIPLHVYILLCTNLTFHWGSCKYAIILTMLNIITIA